MSCDLGNTYNFVIPQGADFALECLWTIDAIPVDLTGYSARCQGRSSVFDTTPIWSKTEADDIALTPSGDITISWNAAETAAYAFSQAVYDLELVSPSGVVTRLLQGTISLNLEVTR